MIEELEMLLKNFPGLANQARYFTHILNLVVKSIMQQFDIFQVKSDEIVDDVTRELLKLAGDIEKEEAVIVWADSNGNKNSNGSGDDNVEGWVNKQLNMSKEELVELNEAIRPVCFMLTKVC